MRTIRAAIFGRSRARGCDTQRSIHAGPVGATPIPSIGRCLSCGCVFGHEA